MAHLHHIDQVHKPIVVVPLDRPGISQLLSHHINHPLLVQVLLIQPILNHLEVSQVLVVGPNLALKAMVPQDERHLLGRVAARLLHDFIEVPLE